MLCPTALETRVWIGTLVAAAASLGTVASGAAIPITDYRDNFKGTGWAYLWNAPTDWNLANTPPSTEMSTGAIGSVADYEALIWTGSYFSASGSATPAPAPARFLRMDAYNIQPGASAGTYYDVDPGPSVVNEQNEQDRYAIAAFTVTLPGLYAITDSTLTLGSGSDGVEVLAHVGSNTPTFSTTVPGGATSSFNGTIGLVATGQTIYIAFGPGVTANSDFASNVDFTLSIVPEPASLVPLAAGGALMLAPTRRRR